MLALLLRFKTVFFVLAIGCAIAVIYQKAKTIQKNEDKIVTLQRDNVSLSNVIDIERANALDAQQKSVELETQLTVSQDKYAKAQQQIELNKTLLNKSTHLNMLYVQYIRAEASNHVPTSYTATEQSRAASQSVPTDRVLHYTVAVINHDQDCSLRYNTLLNLYNAEMLRINNFK